MKKIDIIIPIYNAYEYTEECIKSVLKNTDLQMNKLILINDKSPDEKILPMLKKYQEENESKNIIILDNDENLGFVKTVNKGMKLSGNDVILLNSDTEVTKNWLEKMQECAYSSEYIATVTPFTNNGTIFSIPNFGVDNELPKNMSLEDFAELVEKCSEKRYPEVTTGNGYCMYIKRNVLEEIGLFDDITFEKGFGEENDFCYRALDYGYTNVLCDNTFIYHKGTQSFKVENMTQARAELVKSHMKKLTEKYPIYVQKTNQFISANPFKEIQENININIEIYRQKRILFLINEWQEDMLMTGGTSLHLKDVIDKVSESTACFILAPNKYDLASFDLYLYTKNYSRKINSFRTNIRDYGQIVFENKSYKGMLEKIFNAYRFDVVHVQHLLFHTFDIIDVAKKYNSYNIISLHDLYMLCPSINMVYEEKYCETNKERDCKTCLHRRYGINHDIVKKWRRTCNNVLQKFDKIIVPSNSTKNIFNEVYKDLKIDVVEHGTNVIEIKYEEKEKKEKFKIAFTGVMAPHKGSKVLKNMIEKNKNNNIEIHLFGKAYDTYLTKNRNNYFYHGEYRREELPRILTDNEIDLVCILSTVPETYSYTLTEAFLANIPVLSFDIGAVAERIEQGKLGWTINLNTNEEKILSKIEEISKNTNEYNKIKDNFKNYKFKTVQEMQKEYKDIYDSVQRKTEKVANLYELIDYQKQNTSYQYQLYTNEYGHVVYRYEKMRNSKVWKLAKKIKSRLKK